MGYIYILTNPSFPDYIKIGYADDVKKRLTELNRSECMPFAFRVFATYEVRDRLTDINVHNMLDKANPDLRSIDEFDGKKRIREFYAMSPEDAYSFFQEMAKIHGTIDKLVLWKIEKHEMHDEKIAEEIKRARPINFSTLDIKPGNVVELWYHGQKIEEYVVSDNKHVICNGENMSLTGVVKTVLNIVQPAGPGYFKYKGEWINDLRRRKREIDF